MRGITKRYGATLANDRIDFSLQRGEIHVLLGENGAGKSTLVNILFGLVQPDAGKITVDGAEAQLKTPHDALARGIGAVHQSFMLVPTLTVAENVVLGSRPAWPSALKRKAIESEAQAVAQRFRIDVDVRAKIGELSVELQQRVEILRLLYREARILALDEPTALLGPTQTQELFMALKDLQRLGHSIVLVTHKLAEALAVADRVTVLREGRRVTTLEREMCEERGLIHAMIGGEVETANLARASFQAHHGRVILDIRNLASGDHLSEEKQDDQAHRGMSFRVRSGEILGIAGVEGNGQREIVGALAGTMRVTRGQILLDGVDLTGVEPRTLRAAGIGVVPEDRRGAGLALDLTLAENLLLGQLGTGTVSRSGFLKWKAIMTRAKRLLDEYDIRPPDPQMRAIALSGGNQQKLVLARELARRPKVLIAERPTQGLDVVATEFIHRRLLQLREEGAAVVVISSDLDELFKVSDRITVVFRQRMIYDASVDEIAIEQLGAAMAGTWDQAKECR